MSDKTVISYVSKKGGVGKSTSVVHTAHALHAAGKNVCIVDFDPDGTVYKQSKKSELLVPVLAGKIKTVSKQINELEYDYVVIDTPPQDESLITRVAQVSDDVITPLSPTSYNLDRLLDTVTLVEEVEALKQKPLLSVLITMFRSNVNSGKTILEALGELPQELPILDSKIRLLDRYTQYEAPTYLDEYTDVLKEIGIL